MPTISGGVVKSISFNFWSGSRSSVKSTRRKVFQRASKAAKDEATPTLSRRVKSKSRMEAACVHVVAVLTLTLANPLHEVKRVTEGE